MHFFSPANVMKLLEIVRGEETAPDVLATAMAVGRKISKVPVVVGVCHGFVGNRMLPPRGIEAEKLLLEGALPQDVDGVLTDFGFPMGPFAMGDLAGLDVGWRIRKERGVKRRDRRPLCEQGRFGQKTGEGFYRYEKGAARRVPTRRSSRSSSTSRRELGVKRRADLARTRSSSACSIRWSTRARASSKRGIAIRAGDIDVIWVYGYGFPVWRGGPMFWADTVGPEEHPRPAARVAEDAGRGLEAGSAAGPARDRRQDFHGA